MTDTPTLARSQDEVAERLRNFRDNGALFSFGDEVLFAHLDREHAVEFAKADSDMSEWTADDPGGLAGRAADYLDFAFGKARDHRGISALRSVQKMTEYAWLQGRDDVVTAMADARESNYGVAELMAYAHGFGLPIPKGEDLRRMADGLACHDGCEEGCE